MIYLIGAPGSGKSTLMAKLTEHLERDQITGALDPSGNTVAHDRLHFLDGEIAGAEIGKRREHFGGTDALPASIIEKAIPWLQSKPYNLIFAEGARLANKRFIDAAVAAGYKVHLGLLEHPLSEEWRSERAKALGKDQSAAWVKGRATASNKLAKEYLDHPEAGVTVYVGHPARLLSELEHLLG